MLQVSFQDRLTEPISETGFCCSQLKLSGPGIKSHTLALNCSLCCFVFASIKQHDSYFSNGQELLNFNSNVTFRIHHLLKLKSDDIQHLMVNFHWAGICLAAQLLRTPWRL